MGLHWFLAPLPGQNASSNLLLNPPCPVGFIDVDLSRLPQAPGIRFLTPFNRTVAEDTANNVSGDDDDPENELKMIKYPLHVMKALPGLFGFAARVGN